MNYIRDNAQDNYGILQLQDLILQIAVYIDDFCSKNGITYYLMGGSALGAARHGGFIPWDDDLDIFMKPNDYATFRKLFLEKGNHEMYYLQEQMRRGEMLVSAKLRMNHTFYQEKANDDMHIHKGIFVDIFILHNTSNNRVGRLFHCLSAKYLLIKGQGFKNIKYKGFKGFAIWLLKLFPKEFGIKRNLKRLYKYDNKKTHYLCHFLGKAFFKKGIYLVDDFKDSVRVQFEKVELLAPCGYDNYLTKRFGDYMKMPNPSQIKDSQHASLWLPSTPNNGYDGDYFDEKYLV